MPPPRRAKRPIVAYHEVFGLRAPHGPYGNPEGAWRDADEFCATHCEATVTLIHLRAGGVLTLRSDEYGAVQLPETTGFWTEWWAQREDTPRPLYKLR